MSIVKILPRAAFTRILGLVFCGAVVLTCESQTIKIHEPSAEEAEILRTAGRSVEFDSSEGPSLRAGLRSSGEKQYNVESAHDDALPSSAGLQKPINKIAQSACAARVVAVGKVTGQTSALSSNDANVITLYNFVIQTALKQEAHDLTGKKISVLRRGGIVNTPEGLIRQLDLNTPLLTIGKDYVLLLRELPGTRGYVSATDVDFAVIPNSGRVEALKGNGRDEMSFDSLQKFGDALHEALLQCGPQQ